MRVIYWRRYGVLAPLLIVALSTSLAIAAYKLRFGKHLRRSLARVSVKRQDDVDSPIKRPNIDEGDDDDVVGDFGDLVPDPEDVWTDSDAIALNPDVIPEAERLKGSARSASDEDSYATVTPSDLVEDKGRGDVSTTPGDATTEHSTVNNDEGTTVTSPGVRRQREEDGGDKEPFGLSDYQSRLDQGGQAMVDFQDAPLSPDEEYNIRLAEAEGDDVRELATADDQVGVPMSSDAGAGASPQPRTSGKPLNVLFVIVDDLRPQLGAYEGRDYGAPYDRHKMYTPHLDRLAKSSLVLKRAYAQYSMCGPSRASMMTSRRPDVTKVYQNYVYWRYWSVGNFTTIPQYFKENGYITLGAGKVFHVDQLPKDYDPPSWSLPYFRPVPSSHERNASLNWAAVPDETDELLVDQSTTRYAVEKLAELSEAYRRGVPFFFAIGYNQPHFRHICPARFFEHYPLERKKCMYKESWQTPPYAQKMNLAPLVAGLNNSDLTHIPSVAMREIRRAYFACISYVDSLVGELLSALDRQGLADDTIVVFTSDQGYHLGDNDMFGVYSNHEMALHVPLILKIPGMTDRGVDSRSLVELLDIFPTLVEAAGLPPVPKCPERSSDVRICTDGVSLLPLISHPKKYLKDAVYSQLARGRSLTEYAVRTNKYRLIDLALHRRTKLYPGVYQHTLDFDLDLRGRRHGRRLYDLVNDPLESENVADNPSYADTTNRLRAKLRHTFKHIYDYSKYLYYSFPE